MITIEREVTKVVTEEYEDIEDLVEHRCIMHPSCAKCPMYAIKQGVRLPRDCKSTILHFLYGYDNVCNS